MEPLPDRFHVSKYTCQTLAGRQLILQHVVMLLLLLCPWEHVTDELDDVTQVWSLSSNAQDEGITLTKSVLDVLYTAQTLERAIYHDGNTTTQRLTLLHTATNTTQIVNRHIHRFSTICSNMLPGPWSDSQVSTLHRGSQRYTVKSERTLKMAQSGSFT